MNLQNQSLIIQENTSLKQLNTFGINAHARYFAGINNQASLHALLTDAKWQNTPKLILGSGSNVLFTKDYEGLVIKNDIRGITIIAENNEHIWLKVGAGENWHDFVMHCVHNQWAGIENLSLIPGTVGAAPIQNIGAYGVELCETFQELEAMCIRDGSMHVFNQAACQFDYRNSIFKNEYKNRYIICNVTIRLNKNPQFNIRYDAVKKMLGKMGIKKLNIKAISDAVISIRQNKLPDPKKIGNAGSFFKNPEISLQEFHRLYERNPNIPHYSISNERIKIPAAWLIEQCGWRGYRKNGVGVHDKQALVLVNYGSGSGEAIKNLAHEIQESVSKQFTIKLIPEVNII